ncbi:putative 2-nitropropane dioxygenase [Streptomyces hiroshimensis]|uniref:2-nitropropane dioxygenase n=1 Tax=Streptomyces hiroshimensis TaxID=66424 RepID=A0ABQ2YZH8_9ACTN|nr:putative 2-nitropropane dioxygenase [Streptomyces hiroshimensis]
MQTELSQRLGIEHAVFGFTPFPAVAAAISRAGGLGVLGAVRYTDPAALARDLAWMDAHTGGRPYGLDVVMPAGRAEGVTEADVEAMIPDGHRRFVRELLARHGVPELAAGDRRGWRITGWLEDVARAQLDAAFDHPLALLANALGPPPADVVQRAHAHGTLVAALAGSARHATRHADAGIDVVVAQGYEAGGHTGEIATMVLTPEIVRAVGPLPVLAAGGIGSGEQIAAGLALGAQGVWLGSLWLTTEEADLGSQALTAKLLAAGSGDTVRSRALSGKPARQLRTAWTEAWDDPSGPGPLPMPLQGLLVAEALTRIQKYEAAPLLGTPVGQIVGSMNSRRSVQAVFDDLTRGFDRAVARLGRIAAGAGAPAGRAGPAADGPHLPTDVPHPSTTGARGAPSTPGAGPGTGDSGQGCGAGPAADEPEPSTVRHRATPPAAGVAHGSERAATGPVVPGDRPACRGNADRNGPAPQ